MAGAGPSAADPALRTRGGRVAFRAQRHCDQAPSDVAQRPTQINGVSARYVGRLRVLPRAIRQQRSGPPQRGVADEHRDQGAVGDILAGNGRRVVAVPIHALHQPATVNVVVADVGPKPRRVAMRDLDLRIEGEGAPCAQQALVEDGVLARPGVLWELARLGEAVE